MCDVVGSCIFFTRNVPIIRLLLNVNMYNQSQCIVCERNENNDIVHILMHCKALERERRYRWEELQKVCPKALAESLNNLGPMQKTLFILNGAFIRYNHEWQDIFCMLSNYVFYLHSLYDRIANII